MCGLKWWYVCVHVPSVRCMSEFQATEPHQKPHHCCLQSSALYGTNILLLQITFPLFDTPLNRSNYRSFPRHLLLSRGNLILKQENFCAKVMPEHKQTTKHPFTFACQSNLSNTVRRQLPETRNHWWHHGQGLYSRRIVMWANYETVPKVPEQDIALKLDVSVEVMCPHERQ